MQIAVLADTHAPRFWKGCPPRVADLLGGAELILHAGDVCTPDVLDELATWAPVVAVAGNNDGPDVRGWSDGVPEQSSIEIEGVRIALVHDSGAARGRGRRLLRRFPGVDLVVFGHSHIPWDETTDGQRAFNPGSPTDKRRAPHATMGLLLIEDGHLLEARIREVD